MILLQNASLTVAILDPVADRERFGTRYCTGGYIFQITDAERGELLSGPTFPDSFNTFDGQGIPDAFNLGPVRDPAAADGAALIIGTGLCDLRENRVIEFCRWDVEAGAAEVRMGTVQALGEASLEVERTVSLHGRTVRSATRLGNRGRRPLPVRWFPHPFFPQPETDELCRFSPAVRLPDNPAYAMADNGFIRRLGWPWEAGHYQALEHGTGAGLVVLQRHPKVGLVAGTFSYWPTYLPIWGNPRTFSWEPFLEGTVGPGQEKAWFIDYDF